MLHTTPRHQILKALLSTGLIICLIFVASCEDEPKDPGFNPNETQQVIQNDQNSQTSPPSEVFEVVEEQPVPKGGFEAFYKTIGENIKYPEEAASKGIEGRVYVQFVVDEMGNLSEVKTLKGLGSEFDKTAEEAIRKTSWEPGRQRGKAVKVRMVMPIVFKL